MPLGGRADFMQAIFQSFHYQKRAKKIYYLEINLGLTFMHVTRQLCITFMHSYVGPIPGKFGVNSRAEGKKVLQAAEKFHA